MNCLCLRAQTIRCFDVVVQLWLDKPDNYYLQQGVESSVQSHNLYRYIAKSLLL